MKSILSEFPPYVSGDGLSYVPAKSREHFMTLTFGEGSGCAKGKSQGTWPGFHDWNLSSFGYHGWAWQLNSELLTVFHADAEPDCVLYSPSTGSHHSRKLWGNCAVWDSSGFLHPSPASPPQWCLCPSGLYKHKLAWEHSKSFCFSSAQVLGLPDRWAERLECLVPHQQQS